MQANVAHQEQRRQDRILIVLAVALVASQAFSDILTRNALGSPDIICITSGAHAGALDKFRGF